MIGRYSGLFLFACSVVVATLLKKKSSKAAAKDDMSKSVRQYDRHFIIIDGEPSQWEKRLENEKNHAVAQLSTMLSQASKDGIIGRHLITAGSMVHTIIDAGEEEMTSILVYPEEVMFRIRTKGKGSDDMQAFGKFIIDNSRKGSNAGSGPWSEESIAGSGFQTKKLPWRVLVLVCAHQKRDALCGRMGPKIISAIRKSLESSGAAQQEEVQVMATSHIGGHKYAGTLIIYPRATWMGRIKAGGKGDNIQRVIEAAIYDLDLLSKRGGDGEVGCHCGDEMSGVDESCFRGNGHLLRW